jgi:hypothetical protein
MGISTTWLDRFRSRLTGQPAKVYATRRLAQADLHALALIRAGSDYTRPKLGDPSGKLMDVLNYEPGLVIHMDSNRQFLEGPVGTGTTVFIQVEQAILRGCGARWRFPKYSLVLLDQLDLENQHGVGRNIVAGSRFTVAQFGGNFQAARSAWLHPRDTFLPALDDTI